MYLAHNPTRVRVHAAVLQYHSFADLLLSAPQPSLVLTSSSPPSPITPSSKPNQQNKKRLTNGVVASPTLASPAAAGSGSRSSNTNSKEQRATVITRVAETTVPPVLLAVLDAEARKKEALAAGNRGAPLKVMRRSPRGRRTPHPQQEKGNSEAENQVKTIEDREREYNEIRARTFRTKSPILSSPTSMSTPRSSSPCSVAPVPTSTSEAAAAAAGEGTAEAGSPGVSSAAIVEEGTSAVPPALGGTTPARVESEQAAKKTAGDVPAVVSVAVNVTANGQKKSASSVKAVAIVAPPATTAAVTGVDSNGKGEGASGPGRRPGSGGRKGTCTSVSAAAVTSTTTPIATGSTTTLPAAGKRAEREAKQVGGATTSQGPDGTAGFGRGRGRPLSSAGRGGRGERSIGGAAAGKGVSRIQGSEGSNRGGGGGGDSGRGAEGGRGGRRGGARGVGGRGSRKAPVNAGESKGLQGAQRNRMAEKSDPNFVHNCDNHRPNFAPFQQLAGPAGGDCGRFAMSGSPGDMAHGHGHQPQPHPPRVLHQHQVSFVEKATHIQTFQAYSLSGGIVSKRLVGNIGC